MKVDCFYILRKLEFSSETLYEISLVIIIVIIMSSDNNFYFLNCFIMLIYIISIFLINIYDTYYREKLLYSHHGFS